MRWNFVKYKLMKKKIEIVIIILLLIISIYLLYRNQKIKVEMKDVVLQSDVTNEDLIVSNSFETKVLNVDDNYVKFDIKYPYFVNANNNFNLEIESIVKAKIEDHKRISKENWLSRYDTQLEGENIPSIPDTEDDKYSFFSDFEIVQSNSMYISLIFKYGGFSGGAHGYEDNISFNYDIKNQKILELKDMFPNDSEYLLNLSTKSRELLKNEFATISEEDKENSSEIAIKEYVDNMVSMIESGTEPTEGNFSTFTFTPDVVNIYFAQYQVGPYVIGMPKIKIDRK